MGVVVPRNPAAVAATVLLAVSAVPGVSPETAAAGAPPWTIAPPIQLGKNATDIVLHDVSVLGPSEVWVIGGYTSDTAHTLAARWNGSAWTVFPTPDASAGEGTYGLNAVDALSTNDVWAVGSVDASPVLKSRPLFLHYDGFRWTEQPGPSDVNGELNGLDMLAPDEGWAVGDSIDQPMILHRTGGQWTPVLLPMVGMPASLTSVVALSPTDAWAVGKQTRAGRDAALVLHWNGSAWAEVTVPDPGPVSESLNDVAAASPTDIWTAGTLCSPICKSLVLHRSGGTWRTEATAPEATLTSVIAFSPSDVWVFGQSSLTAQMLDHVEHWNGQVFSVDLTVPQAMPEPSHPASAVALNAAAADPQSRTMWAVGWIQGTQKTAHALFHS
jgi:hypothetical protein